MAPALRLPAPLLKFCRSVLMASLGLSGFHPARSEVPQPNPSRVYVVANSAFPGSRELGEYYLSQRGLPKENLILLDLPTVEEISRTVFVTKIQNPLVEKLLETKAFRGILSSVTNAQGVRLASLSAVNVDWLVLIRGVPLKVAHDPAYVETGKPGVYPQQLKTTAASVDGELSLLPGQEWNAMSLTNNPWFNSDSPVRESSKHKFFLKISRLDGPDDSSVRSLIESALDGERIGLSGRFYLDRGGPYQEGNDWIDRARTAIKPLGFETSFDERMGVLFGPQDRFDAPAFYLGWYEGRIGGPFTFKDFRFPPGALAVHLHSYSAYTLRKADENWCAPLVSRGVAGTLGNVYEPYLSYTNHFDILADRLAKGWCWGDAAFASMPGLSWMNILLGDPLYQPFKRPLEDQIASPAASPAARRAKSYAALRQANLLEAAGDSAAARALLVRFNESARCLAVAARLALPELAAGNAVNARSHLSFAFKKEFAAAPDEIGLCLELAKGFRQAGDKPATLILTRLALDSPHLTDSLRPPLLLLGAELADYADDRQQAKTWRNLHEKLVPPSPPK